jgi:signal transduction histidine kinase
MRRAHPLISLLLLILLATLETTGQTRAIDSLKQRLSANKSSQQLQTLLSLGEHHQSINRDSLYRYALQARKLASHANDPTKRTLADIMLINAHLRFGHTDSATVITDSCLAHYSFKQESTRSIYFTLAALKADCYGDASNYKDALSQLYTIITEAEQVKDSVVVSRNMNTIGVINYNLDHVPQAFSWYFKGLGYTRNTAHFYSSTIVLYINLAETYRWVGKNDSAKFYIDKAIPLSRSTQNLFFLANALRVKASIYKDLKQFVLAEQTMVECIGIRQKIEGDLSLSNEQIALSSIYMRGGKPAKAIELLTYAIRLTDSTARSKSTKTKIGDEATGLKISAYQILAKCYQQTGDDKNYQATLEKIIAEKDAYYASNSARAIAELETKYEFQKKESTITKQQLAITRKDYLLYGSIIITGLVVLVVWLLFINYQRKQGAKMQVAVNEEKRIAALSIIEAEEKERRRIAADLHDNIGAYATAIRADVEKLMGGESKPDDISLHNLQNHSQEIINSLRDTIWVLNKEQITITEISDRIKNYISKFRPTYTHINFHVHEDIVNDITIGSRQALNVFRIVQEALHNAVKHSKAANVTAAITCHDTLSITINDDGIGMKDADHYTNGNGLINMKERAGEAGMKLDLQSTHGKGTGWALYTTN